MSYLTAQKVLRVIGAEEFGQPDVAEEALEIATDELRAGQDIVRVSFKIFMELLDDYGRLEEAFESGLEYMPVNYLRIKIAPDDVEDVVQKASMSAWSSFRKFVAEEPGSWRAWLFMIARNKMNSHLEWLYTREKYLPVYADMSFIPEGYGGMWERRGCVVEQGFYDEGHISKLEQRGWSIPEICREWIECVPEDAKAAFAAQILAIYQGQSEWVGPSGTKMCTLVGLDKSSGSRTKVYRWWKEFIEEVQRRESKS